MKIVFIWRCNSGERYWRARTSHAFLAKPSWGALRLRMGFEQIRSFRGLGQLCRVKNLAYQVCQGHGAIRLADVVTIRDFRRAG